MGLDEIKQALALAPALKALHAKVGERLVQAGNIPLRTDHMPVRIAAQGAEVGAVRLMIAGWNKLNFETLRLLRFDIDDGVENIASRYEVDGAEGEAAQAGLAPGTKVLTRWAKRPAWVAKTEKPAPLAFLEFQNRRNTRGARSAKLSITTFPPGAPVDPKAKPLFQMDGPAHARVYAAGALNELVALSQGLTAYLAAGAAAPAGPAVASVTHGDLGAIAAALTNADGVEDSTIDDGLAALAAGGANLLLQELWRRIPAADWTFAAPEDCTAVRLMREPHAGSFSDEAPVALTFTLSDEYGLHREITVMFGGEPPAAGGLSCIADPPQAPEFAHRWYVSAPPGSTIVSVGFRDPAWPMPAALVRIVDASPSSAPRELNPVRAALELIQLSGKLSLPNRREGQPMLVAYAMAWGQFLTNRFGNLRSAWQAKLIPDTIYSDLSAPAADFNRGLEPAHHRIVSKHGFSKPLYARNIPSILKQLRRFEDIVLEETGARLFVSYGTLLGCIRDKAFIAHDDDIDVAWVLEADDFDDMLIKRRDFLDRLEARPDIGVIDPYPTRGRVNCTIKVKGLGGITPLDLFPIWRTPDGVVHGMMERLKVRPMTQDWFQDYRREPFYGGEVWVPSQAEAFLQDRYGPGWVTPDPSYGMG